MWLSFDVGFRKAIQNLLKTPQYLPFWVHPRWQVMISTKRWGYLPWVGDEPNTTEIIENVKVKKTKK